MWMESEGFCLDVETSAATTKTLLPRRGAELINHSADLAPKRVSGLEPSFTCWFSAHTATVLTLRLFWLKIANKS